jgi:hypothetical protein
VYTVESDVPKLHLEETLFHVFNYKCKMPMNKVQYSLECEILNHLLRAQLEMQLWNFLPSLMLLHLAYTRLTAWESRLQNREVCLLGSHSSSIILHTYHHYIYMEKYLEQ